MKSLAIITWMFVFYFAVPAQNQNSGENSLTEKEKKGGWKLLFNGSTKKGWRNYQNKPGDSWIADSGTLHCLGSAYITRNNLITEKQFQNFDLSLDWKLAPQGNSGVLYMVTEHYKEPYLSGPEYQVIDDKNFPQKLESWQLTGANYAMDPPRANATKPAGEWNHTRIIVNNGHIEHWLNGVKLVSYKLWSAEWKKHKSEGKWKNEEGYGMSKKGHICLQDHGSEVWFKNIKIKEL
ncbi:MAG TPA: DUF1080 domain-containing protein [Flavisolibacter sp.]|jgi:hypothetical protein|nr:DUF1080 domain-containing protein [Flavisolibacter sp.]